jgi:anti-sigma B factor antagonist
MRVDVQRAAAPPAARVRPAGELDLATAPALQRELDTLLDGGYVELDVDLDELSFCDVAGLSVLLRARVTAVGRGGRVTLHGRCPPLLTMLHVLRLQWAFEPIAGGEPGGHQA